jgi:hypothetical protein
MWNRRRENLRTVHPAFVFLTALAAILQGCATAAINLSAEDRASLKNAPAIYIVRYHSVPFDVMTPKSAVGAGLVASMTKSSELPSGFELERAFGLPEASSEIANHFARKLASEGQLANLRVVSKPMLLPFKEEVSHYGSKYAGGLVLEIYAMHSAGYQVMHWQTYNFGTWAKVRLIRVTDNKVLWKDMCSVSGQSDDALTLNVTEFEANNGARLKHLSLLGADRCSRILTEKFLGKTS